VLALSAAAADDGPSIVLRFKHLDGLIADMRHLYKVAGREDEGKDFEKRMQAGTGAKGIEGVDTKKPFGLVVDLQPRLPDSRIWLLLPVADEKAFLKFLESVEMKPARQKDGSYEATLPGLPIYNTGTFRIAHGYLYGTIKLSEKTAIPADEKLPKGEALLGKSDAIVALSVDVQKVPPAIRKLAVSFIGLQLGSAKDVKPDGETKAQTALREAIIDEATARLKSLFEDAETITAEMSLSRGKSEEFTLSATLTGKKGSVLAEEIASLGGQKGVALGGKGAVMSASAHLSLPGRLRRPVRALVDEAMSDSLDRLAAHEREMVEPLLKSIAPTLKMGVFDGGLRLLPAGKGGKHSFIGGARIKGGADVEKAVKDVLEKMPERDRKGVSVDAHKAGGVNIHSVSSKGFDAATRELLGEKPVYFAIKGDAVLMAGGEDALALIKEAVAAKAVDVPVLEFHGDLEKMAALLKGYPDTKHAPGAAKEAFKDGGGKVRLSVTGGERLQVKLSVQTAVLGFITRLEKAEKEK
jgi:hypothetical protein